jgi:hypothetical protein
MKRKVNMPSLVYWGLWGINSRAAALGFFWLCLGLGAGSVVYGFADIRAFKGAIFLLAAAWYWCSIRWADKNSGWGDQ